MATGMMSKMLLVLFLNACLFGKLSHGQTACSSKDANTVQLNRPGLFSSVVGSGRVEICVCSTDSSCFWQTVSTGSLTVPFSWKNSIVVCRELGFFDVQSPVLQNTVPDNHQASDLVNIFEATFLCDGTESYLADCAQEADSSSDTHQADAYVSCQRTEFYGKVRLTGSTTKDQGVVEYYRSGNNGTWVTICHDFWSNNEADILCKMLGYESGTTEDYSRSSLNGPNIENTPAISSVSCLGNEVSFSSCTIVFTSVCANVDRLAGAICVSDTSQADGSVRLYQTSTISFYSRVEVFYGGRWGTVCNTAWGSDDGQVACRELSRNLDGTTLPTFETGFIVSTSSRPLWVVGYNCEGTESNLRSCSLADFPIGFVSTQCSHSVDAGLSCGELIIPPKPFPPGGVAGIILSITAVLLIIFIIVFNDKWKKGEVQAWYRPRRNRWRRWRNDRRRRFQQWRQTRQPHQPSVVPAVQSVETHQISSSLAVSNTPGPQSQPAPVAEQHTNPDLPGFNDSQLTAAAAPPSYDDALRFQHVKPPPVYNPQDEDKILPYPVSLEFHPAHPPPPGLIFQDYNTNLS